ncbi:MAG: GEVED domain-containing protein [Vicingaceae bacterium]
MRKLYRFTSALMCITALGMFSAKGQTYCSPQTSSGCTFGDQIENFSTTGGTTNITNNGSGCSAGYYQYFSNMTVTGAFNDVISFTVQAGSAYQQGHRIWIDWNNDKDFTDPGEDIWNSGTYSTSAYNGTFTIPTTATPGTLLRMRVRCSYVSVPSDPCANQSYGEVEDYNIFVVPPVANDAGVASIVSPAPYSCTLSDSIIVALTNNGTQTLTSANINWSINGGTASSTSWTGSIASNTTSNVFLGTASLSDGDVLSVWTDSPNNVQDSFPANDTVTTTLYEAISGTFTVGGTSPDYATINDAMQDLYFRGVCGPVILSIRAGTYVGQVVVGAIQGVSATSTVTLQPDTGVVTIEYTPSSLSDNAVVMLDGADYIIFNDLVIQVGSGAGTYATVVNLGAFATHNEFNNCQLNGNPNATTSTYQSVIYCTSSGNDYNKFMNSEINGGSYGVYFFGGGTTSPNVGNMWVDNTFKDAYYRGLYVYYSKDLIFNKNWLESNTTYLYGYGFMSYYTDGASECIGNHLSWPGYSAMYLYQWNGNATDKPIIANNMVNSGAASYYTYGTYLYGGFMQIINNTIVKNSGSSYGYYGAYIAGGGNTVLNNIIYDPAGLSNYYTLYYGGGFAVLESDHNDVFTPNTFGYFNGVQSTLSDWQNATGFDMNSITTDPGFTNYDSLRTCNDTLDGAGTPVSFVLDDYDGDDRDPATPDIGADEFIGADSGSYSAGPDAIVCDGKSVQIGLQQSQGTFLWSTSETTSTITVSQAGTYQVAVTTGCGATHTDEVVVENVTPTSSFTVQDNFQTGIFTNISQNGDNYRWVVQTNPFDTIWAQNLTYVFPDNGPYQVCLTTYNDCDTVTSCGQWLGFVGINEVSLSDVISLMPNPASDVLNITFNGLEDDQINLEVSNIQGQVVYNENFVNVSGNANRTIDVSSLKKGMYILKFSTENDVTAKRVIVQ